MSLPYDSFAENHVSKGATIIMTRTPLIALVGTLALTLTSACAPSAMVSSTASPTQTSDKGKPSAPEQAFTRFPDIPVPAGAKIDLDKTLVFGGGETWFGRIAMSANYGADKMFDFYKQDLPSFGWQEITSIRSANSVLTYQREDRIATIQISGSTLQGTQVLITVSPKGAPMQAPPSSTR